MSAKMIGVMQGRLSPKHEGRYQAFPVDSWQTEFFTAQKLGVGHIEFIIDDFSDLSRNPLLSGIGLKEISELVYKTGTQVKSICADYFMDHPFSESHIQAEQSLELLKKLIAEAAPALGVECIVLPCVDQSSLKGNPQKQQLFAQRVSSVLQMANKHGVRLALETDLPPDEFRNLLDQFPTESIFVNYDIGNSASMGYNPIEEFEAYGDVVCDVHIKDRTRNGGPVVLGQGDADFEIIFNVLRSMRYDDLIVMQAYRDDEGLSIFQTQMEWVAPFLNSLEQG